METHVFSLGEGASRIEIAPGFGCNLCSWQVAERELLYKSKRFGVDPSAFYEGGGTPILFPSVGRTWDRRVSPAVPERYAIADTIPPLTMPPHGILPLGDWTLKTVDCTPARVEATYAFDYPLEVARRHYPFLINFEQSFVLERHAVHLRARFENTGTTAAPFAFGYHPYFRFYSGRASVQLPCASQVELDVDLLVPSGRTEPFDGTLRITADQQCDMAFGSVNGTEARLVDESAGYGVVLECDQNTENYVIYSAAGEPFVCVEPWTRGLGAFETLRDPAWHQKAHLNILEPGEAREIQVVFRYAELA